MNDNTHQGVVVDELYPLTSPYEKLMENDVILSYDGIKIGDDGTIEYRKNSRISLDYITIQKYVNDKATFTILRNGIQMDITIIVEKLLSLIPIHYYDKKSKDLSYFIFGGFVFIPLSLPYLRSYYGYDWKKSCPIHLCHTALIPRKKYKDEEVVIVSCVLADQINIGYHYIGQATISKCNNIQIHNIAQLARICDECVLKQQQNVKFEIQRGYDKKICVLDAKVSSERNSHILNEYQINHDRSFNLRQYKKFGYPTFSFEKKDESKDDDIVINDINDKNNNNNNSNNNNDANDNINNDNKNNDTNNNNNNGTNNNNPDNDKKPSN